MKSIYLLSLVLGITACSAQPLAHPPTASQENVMSTFVTEFLPTHYQQVAERTVLVDGQSFQLLRYQKSTSFQLHTENLSYLSHPQGTLKGFSYLGANLLQGELPTKTQAQKIADDFLQRYAPDLLQHRETHWIDQHLESVHINGKDEQIVGMKVKMRNLNDSRWFWVIIGKNHQPIIFERDIVWVNFPAHRKTEKWLHDSWLKDHLNNIGQAK